MYSHPGSLQGQTVIVTGASRGIGLGIATALAERGAQLFVTDIDAVALQSAVRRLSEIGPAIGALAADLIQPDSPGAVVEAAVDRFGSVHGLVNNAIWIMPARPIDEHTDEHFDRTFDSGPKATFRLMQAVHPHLKAAGGGSIVNLGSSAGTAGQPGMATYGGAKEAIRGISRTAALEWGADNIRVNVICRSPTPRVSSPGAMPTRRPSRRPWKWSLWDAWEM